MSPLKAVPQHPRRWRSFEEWVGSRNSALALFGLALAVFALESVFLPAYPGRDMSRYLETFFQLGYDVPVYPAVLNTRGPLSAIGVGVPLDISGWAAELWLALLYACSIVAWARVALTFGSRAAILTSALLLVFPGYGILFHQLASDSLFAAGFAVWALLMMRAIQRPSVKAFAFAGLGMGALVLVRPANQVLLVMAVLPLVLRAPWRDRFAWLGGVLHSGGRRLTGVEARSPSFATATPSFSSRAPACSLSLRCWCRCSSPRPGACASRRGHGRAGGGRARRSRACRARRPAQYTRSVIRNESNQFLYRSFELDRIMAPENGPASRRLARVVERELLAEGAVPLVRRRRPRVLRLGQRPHLRRPDRGRAGRRPRGGDTRGDSEASQHVRVEHRSHALGPARQPPGVRARVQAGPRRRRRSRARRTSSSGRPALPQPTEGQPIPARRHRPRCSGHRAAGHTRSGRRPPSTTSSSRIRVTSGATTSSAQTSGRLSIAIPTRDGSSRRRPSRQPGVAPLPAARRVWLLLGVVGLAFRRPRSALVAIAPAVAGLVVIAATALVAPAVPEYAAPVSPAFILFAAAGVLGVPVRREASRGSGRLARARRARRRRRRGALGGDDLLQHVPFLRRRRRTRRPRGVPERRRKGDALRVALRVRRRQDVRVPAVARLARRPFAAARRYGGRLHLDGACRSLRSVSRCGC